MNTCGIELHERRGSCLTASLQHPGTESKGQGEAHFLLASHFIKQKTVLGSSLPVRAELSA